MALETRLETIEKIAKETGEDRIRINLLYEENVTYSYVFHRRQYERSSAKVQHMAKALTQQWYAKK